ncbi:MAG: ATP-binding cassette domain-containing protein [Gammaproteobacteria bacterium]
MRAVSHVDLTVGRGQVLGLVGDNAAGKSTLMKILSGAIQPDHGTIRVNGTAAKFNGPLDARKHGIEMIYQDFALIPQLTVTQNIFLGREVMRRRGVMTTLDQPEMERRSEAMFKALDLRVPLVRNAVRDLSGGQQQAVAIARATGFDANLVIMDEPTANLGAAAIEKVRETIKRLKSRRIAVIIISHRLEDVFAVGDELMVMKRGQCVGRRAIASTDINQVLEMIVTGAA